MKLLAHAVMATIERRAPLRSTVLILIVALSLSLFFSPLLGTAMAGERKLTIAAASDLAFALKEIVQEFEETTGRGVVISFGSTGNLTRQIENGAPFDLFFAANESYINQLREGNYILPSTQQIYGRGRIVLAVNRREGAKLERLNGLLDPAVKRIAIANPNHAPYGTAAKEALISAGLWKEVRRKLVYGENIRQTLQFIQTGDAPVGIIALSVADTDGIAYTLIDESLHNPINQAIAIIRRSELQEEALSFIRLVKSPGGRQIMRRYGFLLPGDF
ncbi:MAG: molybdate ABC transporter substrate-binding protein [Thermodesulfobacteriota bacterium]